jgi:hypothetical protein
MVCESHAAHRPRFGNGPSSSSLLSQSPLMNQSMPQSWSGSPKHVCGVVQGPRHQPFVWLIRREPPYQGGVALLRPVVYVSMSCTPQAEEEQSYTQRGHVGSTYGAAALLRHPRHLTQDVRRDLTYPCNRTNVPPQHAHDDAFQALQHKRCRTGPAALAQCVVHVVQGPWTAGPRQPLA